MKYTLKIVSRSKASCVRRKYIYSVVSIEKSEGCLLSLITVLISLDNDTHISTADTIDKIEHIFSKVFKEI